MIAYFLLSNNQNLDDQINNISNDLSQINTYLSNNSIIRIPQFNEKECENREKTIATPSS